MKLRNKFQKKITCPRCGLKVVEGCESCPDCGLVFSRLEVATNKDAKRKIRRGDRDFIIKTSKLPSDIKFIKLLLYCIFLGPVGGHCYYTGRYLRGSALSFAFFALVMFVIFNAPLVEVDGGALIGALSTICGLVECMWIWDLIMIIMKKYKVPVAIDLEGNLIDSEKETKRTEFFKDTILENKDSGEDKVVKNDFKEKQEEEK